MHGARIQYPERHCSKNIVKLPTTFSMAYVTTEAAICFKTTINPSSVKKYRDNEKDL